MAKKDHNVKAGQDHWEMRYSPTVNKDSKTTIGEQFSPKKGKDRRTTYEKVNDTDH